MEWYVLFVQTGKEEQVQRILRCHYGGWIFSSLVPRRLVPEKRLGRIEYISKTLFPGYVFIQADMDKTLYYMLKKIPGYYRVLGNGSYFSKVIPEEMVTITKLVGNSETINISEIYLINSKVIVRSGPLQGMEGLIKKVDPRKKRAKIQLNLVGEPRTVDVGIEVIMKTVSK